MRLIGEVPNNGQARRFCAFLLSESVDTHVDGQPEGPMQIWVKDEDKLKFALEEFEKFQADPDSQTYDQAVKKADAILREREKKRREHQKTVVKTQKSISAGNPRGSIFQQAPLTVILIVLCSAVALFTEFGSPKHYDRAVFRALQFVSYENPDERLIELVNTNADDYRVRLASVLKGEFWRVISPIFIHHGPIHILFNMLWMIQLGRIIEARYGTFRLAMLVLIIAAISNLFQCMVPGMWGGCVPILENNILTTRLGGMSGVVYGLFGYIWMKSIYDRESKLFLPQSTVLIMVGWLFFCMLSPSAGGLLGEGSRVANWAHAIGMIVGMVLAFMPTLRK